MGDTGASLQLWGAWGLWPGTQHPASLLARVLPAMQFHAMSQQLWHPRLNGNALLSNVSSGEVLIYDPLIS